MQKMTGYPSIDKPWRSYYSTQALATQAAPHSIYRYVYEQNKDHMDCIAVRYFGRKISYRHLFADIDNCAGYLHSLGISRGDVVTIQALALPQVFVMIYALSRIGAIANMVFVTAAEKEIHNSLQETGSKLYVTLDALYPKMKHALTDTPVQHVLLLSVGEEADPLTRVVVAIKAPRQIDGVHYWKECTSGKYTPPTEIDDSTLPVVLVYTGGTTGKSKAVVLTNHNMNAVAHQYGNADMGFVRGDTFMDMLPPFIAFGLTVSVHCPLSMGVTTIIIADPTPANAGAMVARYKPNCFVHGMAGIQSIMNHPKLQKMDLSFIKILAAGGESIPVTMEEQVNRFLHAHHCQAKLVIGYGMTEVGATVCTASRIAHKPGTTGIPMPNSSVKIINPDTGEELGYGEKGEICFQTPAAMQGYWKQPEETAQVLRIHDDGLTWVHSGDIGIVDADGFVSVVGRIKRIIDLREDAIYHKVFPKLLEEQLEQCDGVAYVTIVGRLKPYIEHELVGFVVPQDDADRSLLHDAIKAYAKAHLETYERPVEYILLEQFPRTTVGKIDYRKLEELAQNK